MGFLRGGYGEKFDILYTIVIWPVSTLTAMDDWVAAALTSERTYGLNTFGWFANIFSRFGLIDTTSTTNAMQSVLYYFEDVNNSARVIPRSILPDIIFDFGSQSVFFVMALIAFLLEFVSRRFVGAGIFLHVLAVQAFFSSGMTIQISIFNPPVVVALFWAAVLALYMRKWSGRRVK
jgi:hypothetical protein